ncbi:hypothetical protein EBB54_07995 [Schaedlerella arabinosiphila]|uniref:Uncharacterized protein n=1 Tax=Schaedlerella arabinosiphila TaxID=2044587 RepID=A0A426DES1_9FIRM|nr:hypothetical protein EBB54_07995 [Schaedlerella arabinosiphila]
MSRNKKDGSSGPEGGAAASRRAFSRCFDSGQTAWPGNGSRRSGILIIHTHFYVDFNLVNC